MMKVIISAFLEGFTGGNLLGWAELPRSATQLFADENSTQPQAELVAQLLALPVEVQTSPDSSL